MHCISIIGPNFTEFAAIFPLHTESDMAFLRTLGSVLVLLLYLLHQAKCELYHITPEEATDDCSSCITLSQLAANAPIIGSNLTLVFLPGSHNLTTNLSISDISYLSMEASNDSTAQITCELTTSFSLENVQYLQIRDLDFFGCGSNLIKNVAEFVLQDVVFEGHRESGTALQLVATAATLINSAFISNMNGMLRGIYTPVISGQGVQ